MVLPKIEKIKQSPPRLETVKNSMKQAPIDIELLTNWLNKYAKGGKFKIKLSYSRNSKLLPQDKSI